MKIDHFKIKGDRLDYSKKEIKNAGQASFILLYTSGKNLENPSWYSLLNAIYKNVPIISCSTSGEIYEEELLDNSISVVAVQLEKTKINIEVVQLSEEENSYKAGESLAKKFDQNGLHHLLVTSDGWVVNGTQLIEGMYNVFDDHVTISGGMAGDGTNFSETLVGFNDNIKKGNVVAIGFYGENLKVGYGTHGGWDVYGEKMKVTKSQGRAIYELDNQKALPIYKNYMGADSDGLPGTALLYPIAIYLNDNDAPLVRTVININEVNGTIISGEEIAEGTYISFMKSEFDDLLTGVENAACQTVEMLGAPVELALIVSCIGRKLLFGEDIKKEIEVSKKHLGSDAPVIGFYSNGEICPLERKYADLHHQMITITAFSEEN